jgi:hypothetical protein
MFIPDPTLTWSIGAAVHPGGAGGRGAGPAARRGGPGRHIPGQAPAKKLCLRAVLRIHEILIRIHISD